MAKISTASRAVVQQTKTIAAVLTTAAAICVAAVLARLLGQGHIKIAGIDVDVSVEYVPIALTCLTIIHAFLAVFLIRQTHLLWRKLSDRNEGEEILAEVRENRLLGGLEPFAEKRGTVFLRSWADLSFWVSIFLAFVALPAAILPWEISHGEIHADLNPTFFGLLLLTFVLILINWLAGGSWQVALIELAKDPREAAYHRRLDRIYYLGDEKVGSVETPPFRTEETRSDSEGIPPGPDSDETRDQGSH